MLTLSLTKGGSDVTAVSGKFFSSALLSKINSKTSKVSGFSQQVSIMLLKIYDSGTGDDIIYDLTKKKKKFFDRVLVLFFSLISL